MKNRLPALFAGALLACSTVLAAPFEGKVTLQMTSPDGRPMEIRQSIKGDKMRMEMTGQEAAGVGGTIMDLGKNEMTVIMDAQRMYTVMNMSQMPGAPAAEKAEEAAVTLEKTGEIMMPGGADQSIGWMRVVKR